jgi:hypothetical protein
MLQIANGLYKLVIVAGGLFIELMVFANLGQFISGRGQGNIEMVKRRFVG